MAEREAAGEETDRPDSRLRLGLEMTLMAWIRTGLALMGFGFVLARFGLFLQQLEEMGHAARRQVHTSLWFGIVLILFGVIINLIAAGLHYPYMVRTRRGETDLPPTWKLGLLLAVFMAGIGLAMTVLLIFMERST
jgi:putative membrane protein